METMQFGHTLDRIIRETILADPILGTVKLMKVNLSDGFYRVNLNITDILKLGVVFTTRPGQESLIMFPLVFPIGFKNSPPIFSAATEIIANLANQRLLVQTSPPLHPLDEQAELVVSEDPLHSTLPSALISDNVTEPPVTEANTTSTINAPNARDPSLPSTGKPLSYVGIFVDNFIRLAQEYSNSRQV